MIFNFMKNVIVGISVSPEFGLEMAQVDLDSRTVIKYGRKNIPYNKNRNEIADMDIFKAALEELFVELQIQKGASVYINLPTTIFKVVDYPASLNQSQIDNVIYEEVAANPIFESEDPLISFVALNNSTLQYTKVAYEAIKKNSVIELILQIKALGYAIAGIDTTVNTSLNALIYNNRLDISPNSSCVLVLIENTSCNIISLQGRNYIDYYEENISIGDILGEDENSSIIAGAINPIIKNLPSNCLYVISKTNVISAESVVKKLVYPTQIIHQNSNIYADEPFLNVSSMVKEEESKNITLEVIGAAIAKDFSNESSAALNLYNENLGDIYLMDQPLSIKLNGKKYEFSIENVILPSILIVIICILVACSIILPKNIAIGNFKKEIQDTDVKIAKIDKFLKENDISDQLLDEGLEIKAGISKNKSLYKYYNIVGSEIPQKLWLTKLDFGEYITIEGQADNLESIYAFFRSIKDYSPQDKLKLQSLDIANNASFVTLSDEEAFDTESVITSMEGDYYEFRISNAPVKAKKENGDDILHVEGF